jgi:hypothetical protein
MSMKNFSDTIGNRTHNVPACSAVPQLTGLLRAPNNIYIYIPCVIAVSSYLALINETEGKICTQEAEGYKSNFILLDTMYQFYYNNMRLTAV